MSSNEDVPIALQAFVVSVWYFGVAANAFLLALLWCHVPKWRLGKTLLFGVHVVALIFLLITAVPATISLAMRRGPSPAQCAAIAPMHQVPTLLQPLSLCLSAILRWRVVRSTLRLDSKPEPRAERYLLALVGFVLLVVIACAGVAAKSGMPAVWDTNSLVCLHITPLFDAAVILSFLAPIPIMFYCYRRIIKGFRSTIGDNAPSQSVKDMVRLFIVLSTAYYCSYLPLTVHIALLSNGVEISLIWVRLLGLLQTSYSAISPILSIMLTPRYLRIARAVLARRSVTGSILLSKKSIGATARMPPAKSLTKVRGAKPSVTKAIEVVPKAPVVPSKSHVERLTRLGICSE